MFSKLALRNVRQSFRDYGVYLLTLTFGVALFYTFNSLDGQGVMSTWPRIRTPWWRSFSPVWTFSPSLWWWYWPA